MGLRRAREGIIVAALGLSCTMCSSPTVVNVAWVDEGRCATVPLSVREGLPVVELSIGGAPLSLILDTGSVQTVTLLPEDAKRLELVPLDHTRKVTDAWGHVMETRALALPRLDLGGARVSGVRAWEARWGPGASPPVKLGHIGQGVLAAESVTIDVPGSRMLWGDPRACGLGEGTLVDARLTRDGWSSTIDANGHELEVIWDTAATQSVVRRDAVEESKPPVARVAGVDIAFATAELGGLPSDGLIGVDFFRDHVVTFDVARKAIVVHR